MSWFVDTPLTAFQRFCAKILKTGPVPFHVGFIMDGNRRYANKTQVKRKEGHNKGFEKLAECLQWCREFGIREVTVYAFSIENFKRSKEEVDTLMELAREKYKKLLEEKERLMEEGVRIRVIGNYSLIPEDIRKSIGEVMLITKDNDKLFLNIAFAYTSSEEITSTIRTITDAVKRDELNIEDINFRLFKEHLYTEGDPDPDILIRTSGEVRFSDFLLWQIQDSQIVFVDILWPEFSFWLLLACIFKYQRFRKNTSDLSTKRDLSTDAKTYLKNLRNKRYDELEKYKNS